MTHATRAHARLAPSAAHRWMECPGSVRLSEGIEETPSSFAAEGTAAHMLAEKCMRDGFDADRFKGWTVNTQAKDPKLAVQMGWPVNDTTAFRVDAEMIEGVQLYLDVVREIAATADEWEIEQRLDMSAVVSDVFGTGDFIAYTEAEHSPDQPHAGKVTICDLKYGKGVPVDVENNAQLLTYVVGVVGRYHNRGVTDVELVIVQPRAPHRDGPVRCWSTDVTALFDHIVSLQVAAEAARGDDAPFHPGDACRFCRAAAKCNALYTRVMEITMTDPTVRPRRPWKEESAEIELVKTWAKRCEEHHHAEALRGHLPDGAKLVGKRPTRKWKDEGDAVAMLQLAGISDDDIYATSVRSPAQLEKLLSKTEKALLIDLVIKSSSGTVLAPLDDPRPAVDPNDASGFDDHSEGAD